MTTAFVLLSLAWSSLAPAEPDAGAPDAVPSDATVPGEPEPFVYPPLVPRLRLDRTIGIPPRTPYGAPPRRSPASRARPSPPRPPPPPAMVLETVSAFFFGLGFAGGGDELLTAYLTDGSSQTLDAGSGASFFVGFNQVVLHAGMHTLMVGLEAGVKTSSIGGQDTDFELRLLRFPLIPRVEYAIGSWPGFDFFVAAGLHAEVGVQLSGSGALDGLDSTFDNALGWMAEMGILGDGGTAGVSLSVRYTHLRYTGRDLVGSVDASNVGVFMTFQFSVYARERPAPPEEPERKPAEASRPDPYWAP